MLRAVTAVTRSSMEFGTVESSESILRACRLPEIIEAMKRNMLGYFGQVCKREEKDFHLVVRRHVAPSINPQGRPKRTCKRTLEPNLED